MASNLQSGQSLVGLCHGQGSPLPAGPLSHSPICHNGLAPKRSGHGCLCHSMRRGDSWSGKWEGCQYLHPQLPASKTLSQSRLQHRAVQDPCADNSSVPMWLLLPQQQRWYCYLGVFWTMVATQCLNCCRVAIVFLVTRVATQWFELFLSPYCLSSHYACNTMVWTVAE